MAFALLVVSFCIKAGVVPFQFWLADAYAVAPAAVCLLLAGAMSEMGLFGIGRVYFTAFHHALAAHEDTLRAILVGLGLVTAVWGAALALVEDHLKRMLAFVTISAVGGFLCGIGLLTADGAAGAGLYVVADGCGKAGLFACVGILEYRHGASVSARSTAAGGGCRGPPPRSSPSASAWRRFRRWAPSWRSPPSTAPRSRRAMGSCCRSSR